MTSAATPIVLDHRVDLYVPSQCICADPLPQNVREGVIEKVKSSFDEWFGGHAEILIRGDWKLPDGRVAKEDVADIYAFCSSKALEQHQENVDKLAIHIANRLTQDRVLRVFDNLKVALWPNTLGNLKAKKNCACHGGTTAGEGVTAQPITLKQAGQLSKLLVMQGVLRSFSSVDHARRLFCDLLNYRYASGEWPCAKWPAELQSFLVSAPTTLADQSGFTILYLQMSTDELRRGAERQVIQRLYRDDPTFRGLIVVSDRHQKRWELVNVKAGADGFNRLLLRRMRVGVEAVRTATERLATLEIAEEDEATITAAIIQSRHDKAFDVEAVTKQFFNEVANWYFWALKHSRFPKAAPKEEDGRDHVSVIRLITRLVFCWFVKEKSLIPAELFDERRLAELLVGFAPEKASKRDSVFYKAILQNLFFATLNTEMTKREWRRDGQNLMAHSLYRHKSLFTRPLEAMALFKNVPFLNGGLFECLDRTLGDKSKPRYERIDGFSDRPDSQPTVPDFLFFGAARELDLSEEYGDDRFQKVKVRGLIHTLNHYRFTIEESTPLEEEVALDPELAGKIFENLLAAYNPATGATARKQTGSFYTPREIVNYMVDEALIAYLKGTLETSSDKGADLEARLRHLFAYEDIGHRFTAQEVEALISAIDRLKALDPAVGSGAFPMGILHKLVFILGRLDPRNEMWKERQKRRLREAIESAERLEDATIRDNTLHELELQVAGIEEAFEKNALDYGRKLYLIENCLYGVDIQPIAVQIAKMRFFISLVADQKMDAAAENLGVRPLPNLETKLVAANTLVGIGRFGQQLLRNRDIDAMEGALRRVRERHFIARTPSAKAKCRDQDKELRGKIAALLKSEGWDTATAKQLANWDPYDQNASSSFFDPEWMFGVCDGFDITIGNPPYVRADEQSDWNQIIRREILASKQYETLWEKWDLYVPFIERSYKLLRHGGISTLIVSDAFCHSKYAQKSQDWFLRHARILRLDFCAEVKIFDAAVHNLIYFFQKAEGRDWKPERRVHRELFGGVRLLPSDVQGRLTHRCFFPEEGGSSAFSCASVELSAVCYVSVGMVVHADEKVAKGAFELEDVVADARDAIHSRRFVEGKHLERWLPATYKWLEWGTKRAPQQFRRPTFPELYEVPEKLFIHRTAGEGLRSCYDSRQTLCNHTVMVCLPWHALADIRNKSLQKAARYRGEKASRAELPTREELEVTSRRFAVKYLLGVMNSRSAREFLRANRRSNTDLYPDDWKKLPIPDVDAGQQARLVKVVDKILVAKGNHDSNIDAYELEVDEIVSKLYGLTKAGTKGVKERR